MTQQAEFLHFPQNQDLFDQNLKKSTLFGAEEGYEENNLFCSKNMLDDLEPECMDIAGNISNSILVGKLEHLRSDLNEAEEPAQKKQKLD